jgi:hypothetical protein
VFAAPWSYLSELRWKWTSNPVDPVNEPFAPQNQFWHANDVLNDKFKDGGKPNSDTLYSFAWLDLSEPLVLSLPDSNRYHVMQMSSMDSDNFALVGSRATGYKAGNYLIVGPHWHGKAPAGVKVLPPSRTINALIVGRTLVDGPADLPAVHKLQAQYRLTPLSQWGKPKGKIQAPNLPAVWKPYDRNSNPLNEWRTINRALAENPPLPRYAAQLAQFATVGIGPGQDIDKLDEATKRGLARAAVDGRKIALESAYAGYNRKRVNGWVAPPKNMGNLADVEDLLNRAAVCLIGIVTNPAEEATYYTTVYDSAGHKLVGSKRYVMHFAPGTLPEVKAFWSVTIYDRQFNMPANQLNRFAIGDRTAGMKKDADGGLTIYLQADDPGADKRANWMPVPREQFSAAVRAYVPGRDIVEGRWFPAPITEQAD